MKKIEEISIAKHLSTEKNIKAKQYIPSYLAKNEKNDSVSFTGKKTKAIKAGIIGLALANILNLAGCAPKNAANNTNNETSISSSYTVEESITSDKKEKFEIIKGDKKSEKPNTNSDDNKQDEGIVVPPETEISLPEKIGPDDLPPVDTSKKDMITPPEIGISLPEKIGPDDLPPTGVTKEGETNVSYEKDTTTPSQTETETEADDKKDTAVTPSDDTTTEEDKTTITNPSDDVDKTEEDDKTDKTDKKDKTDKTDKADKNDTKPTEGNKETDKTGDENTIITPVDKEEKDDITDEITVNPDGSTTIRTTKTTKNPDGSTTSVTVISYQKGDINWSNSDDPVVVITKYPNGNYDEKQYVDSPNRPFYSKTIEIKDGIKTTTINTNEGAKYAEAGHHGEITSKVTKEANGKLIEETYKSTQGGCTQYSSEHGYTIKAGKDGREYKTEYSTKISDGDTMIDSPDGSGYLKTVETESKEYIDGKLTDSKNTSEMYINNELIKTTIKDGEGKPVTVYKYGADTKDGKRVETTNIKYEADGTKVETTHISYENGEYSLENSTDPVYIKTTYPNGNTKEETKYYEAPIGEGYKDKTVETLYDGSKKTVITTEGSDKNTSIYENGKLVQETGIKYNDSCVSFDEESTVYKTEYDIKYTDEGVFKTVKETGRVEILTDDFEESDGFIYADRVVTTEYKDGKIQQVETITTYRDGKTETEIKDGEGNIISHEVNDPNAETDKEDKEKPLSVYHEDDGTIIEDYGTRIVKKHPDGSITEIKGPVDMGDKTVVTKISADGRTKEVAMTGGFMSIDKYQTYYDDVLIEERGYLPYDGEVDGNPGGGYIHKYENGVMKEVFYFNHDGYITESYQCDENGNIIYSSKVEYDSENAPVVPSEELADENGEIEDFTSAENQNTEIESSDETEETDKTTDADKFDADTVIQEPDITGDETKDTTFVEKEDTTEIVEQGENSTEDVDTIEQGEDLTKDVDTDEKTEASTEETGTEEKGEVGKVNWEDFNINPNVDFGFNGQEQTVINRTLGTNLDDILGKLETFDPNQITSGSVIFEEPIEPQE